MEKKQGIYYIENQIDKHVYIGSAIDINDRWWSHKALLRSNNHHSIHLQNAWNLYEEDNFKFKIYEINNDLEYSELLKREQYYLDTVLKAQEYIRRESYYFIENGYNINPIAGKNRKGTTQSLESIKRGIITRGSYRPILVLDFKGNIVSRFEFLFELHDTYPTMRTSIFISLRKNQYNKNGIAFTYEDLYNQGIRPKELVVYNKGKHMPFKGKMRPLDLYTLYGDFVQTFNNLYDCAKFLKTNAPSLHKKINQKVKKKALIDSMSSRYILVDKGIDMSDIKQDWDNIFIEMSKLQGRFKIYDCFNELRGNCELKELAKVINCKWKSLYTCNNRNTFIKSFKIVK